MAYAVGGNLTLTMSRRLQINFAKLIGSHPGKIKRCQIFEIGGCG
jgi:hypothetical protein